MIILHDSRENNNQHILEYFDKTGIKHKQRALKTGDYSFYIEMCPELGFLMDSYYTQELCIERKNSINELAGNVANNSGDDRFAKELNRMQNIQNVYLVIENDHLDDVMEHNYDSQLNPDSFLRSLLTWQKRSNIYINFVKKENMGQFIFEICKNCLDNSILK